MNSLNEKIILITGAAQGLGAATSEVLASNKATIIAVDVKEKELTKTVEYIKTNGGKAEGIIMDVTDTTQIDNAIEKILKHFQRIDVLVNNAGIDMTKPVEELSIEGFDKVIAINLRAPFFLSQKMFFIMTQQGGGNIINITSTAAKRSWANASAYHASKWGLLGLSHALHVEGRKKNIKVTAVVAGGMRTPFILERFPDTPLDVLQNPKNVAETIKFILEQPEETVIPEIMVLPFHETSWP